MLVQTSVTQSSLLIERMTLPRPGILGNFSLTIIGFISGNRVKLNCFSLFSTITRKSYSSVFSIKMLFRQEITISTRYKVALRNPDYSYLKVKILIRHSSKRSKSRRKKKKKTTHLKKHSIEGKWNLNCLGCQLLWSLLL